MVDLDALDGLTKFVNYWIDQHRSPVEREALRKTLHDIHAHFHVAPAEPVVLTQSEWDDLYFQLRENEMKPTGVIRWFQDNGFALVRTGGAADGA